VGVVVSPDDLDASDASHFDLENVNSRLGCTLLLRREIGSTYLELLQFFLNHRRASSPPLAQSI
jgi:hypothetical protein